MEKTTVTINIDNTSFQLQQMQNFDWLKELGKVFCVFDQQDSGNICFGVERDGKKKFVKYAGGRTVNYSGDPKDAIYNLEKALPAYEELKHPSLIKLENHFSTKDGYAAVFDWFNGECLHSHWAFTTYEKHNDPKSPFYRYKLLPIDMRLKSLDEIFSFHEYVESKGYVAVDFYDGSILYDFDNSVTKICDIDFYRKRPTVNDLGENFWGSKRLKSPEEFELGAPIDEKTNVFNMGAIAFILLGGGLDRSYDKWEASKELYEIALRAVNKDRDQRFSSVSEFYSVWKGALLWRRRD